MDYEDLAASLKFQGFRRYRADQIFDWIYRKRATSFEEMTNLPKEERLRLSSLFALSSLSLLHEERSADGTSKFLFQLQDGSTIESVLIPEEERLTLCISSQVGCGQGCRFCLTGQGGFIRNLASAEVLDQVLAVEQQLEGGGKKEAGRAPKQITNIVLMGMGEPLANVDEVLRALRVLVSGKGPGYSRRRVTLSTAGLVPGMDRLGESGLNINLAVSLNSSTDEVRDRIMPVNRRWPLKELIAACRRYPLDARRRITVEYVLLRGVNDSEEDARRVARLLRGIKCKVNLIPFNPFPGSGFERPDDAAVERFQRVLLDHRYTAPLRNSRGRDISAACGQLRGRLAPLNAGP